MKKISVAMTTYNGEKYINQQLLSIFNQSVKPHEVVIIDDGSSDSTTDLIKNFISQKGLKNWRIEINQQNLGFIANFKKAISLTTGDIIFLCDQDDIWRSDKIELILNIFENKNAEAVSSTFRVIDENGNIINENTKNNFGLINLPLKAELTNIPAKTVMHCNISPGCTSALSRKTADIYINGTDCILPHDFEINLIAAALGGLYFLNLPLVDYRIHSSNTLGLTAKQQTRTEIAEEKLLASKILYKTSSEYRSYLTVCEQRLNALKEKNIFKALRLNLYKEYRLLYSIKERAGDIMNIRGN